MWSWRMAAARWIGLFGMYGIGFGIFWAIGDDDSAGRWHFGRDRRIGAGGVWPFSACAVVFVGCAPCQGMHLGWRQWGIGIAPFIRLQDLGVDVNCDGWVGFGH